MHSGGQAGGGGRSPTQLGRIVEGLAEVGGILAALIVLIILGLITYGVAQRYFFGVPVAWAEDLSSYLLVAFVAFGAAAAYRRGDHIAIDLVPGLLGPRRRKWVDRWSDLAVLLFAGVLGWSAWGQARFAYDFGAYSNDRLELPSWIPFVPLVIGAVLLVLLALVRFAHAGVSTDGATHRPEDHA
ncbi:MAG TPA: TRAP transporter small permease [Rhabdaerophilum sp.]|nr:TRAP transporter small permease [Rhabdaerophilum sp.]